MKMLHEIEVSGDVVFRPLAESSEAAAGSGVLVSVASHAERLS